MSHLQDASKDTKTLYRQKRINLDVRGKALKHRKLKHKENEERL